MSDGDGTERSPLPWIMAALVLVIGGAKVDAARPLLARFIAIAAPIVPVLIGVKRLEGAAPRTERIASAVAWLTILAGEACVAGGVLWVAVAGPLVAPGRYALYAAVAAALLVETSDARGGGKSRFGSYIGIAAGFAGYLSTHPGKDLFSSVFAAFFAALLCGGAVLLVGELLRKTVNRA